MVAATSCAPPNSSSVSSDGGVAAAGAPAVALAATAPVDVVLSDTKGLDAPMTLATFAKSAVAGDVVFTAKNTGTVDHELIVLKSDTAFDHLPVVDGGDPPAAVATGADKVDEGTKAGETGDPNLKPGETRTFTIKAMAAGNYVLVCNLAKHYGLGMRAPFAVTAAAGGVPKAPPPPGPVSVVLSDTAGLNGPMTVVPASSSTPAGDVIFNVKNTGTVDHELIVLKTDTPFDKLPIVDGGDPPAPVATGADKVDEGTKAGETGDPNLKPGGTRAFTIKAMAAGSYVLVCNLSKHYGLGMRAPFTVAASTGASSPAPPPGPVSVALSDTAGLNAPMTVVAASTSAAAGDVVFAVSNTGTVDHELIVLKTDTPFDKLPIVDGGDPPAPVKTGADKVDEGTKAGETGDPNLKPGGTRNFTIKGMAAGNYVLVCNLAKHYGLGMRAPFTVTAAASGTAAPQPPGPVKVTLSDTAGLNGPMTVVAASISAAAGDVIFTVTNTGTVDHELIVLKTGTPFDQLPVVDGGDPPAPVATGADKVDEATKAGETGDPNLKPGESRTFTIKAMAAGSYSLVCNLAKHYVLGMRAPFTVS
jgi:uncharacterized cupredoxin-like copper-binding protein